MTNPKQRETPTQKRQRLAVEAVEALDQIQKHQASLRRVLDKPRQPEIHTTLGGEELEMRLAGVRYDGDSPIEVETHDETD